MKKLIALLVCGLAIFVNMPAIADEIEDDYIDMAADYCISGDYASAMSYLDKLLRINPDNKRALDLKKGLNHIIARDKKSYISGVNPSVKEAQEYRRLGNEQMEYTSLINGTQGENSYLAYYYLGNFFRERNNYEKAIDAYNQAVSAKPAFAQSYLALGITQFDMGRYNSAINPIDKYLTFNPNDDLAYAVKSRIEFQLGMLTEAKMDNDKAIELNDCPEYQFDRAKILFKNRQFKEAKDLFVKVLADIQTSKIYEYMGYCDLELGDYMSALNNIDKALILSNDDQYLENKYNEIKQLLESGNNG
jgi:tetratricopeptide (TPR) repeat protein